jgi:hypothetical protein
MVENSYRRFVLAAIAFLMIASVGFFVARYGRRFWLVEELPPKAQETLQPPAKHPDSFQMITVPTTTGSRHIIDGTFSIVKKMKDIPQNCSDTFLGSFVNVSQSGASVGQTVIADPQQDFESTDAIRGGLPFRRLEVIS